MNKARIRKLADFICRKPGTALPDKAAAKRKGFKFNMASFSNAEPEDTGSYDHKECGTVGCIALAAVVMFGVKARQREDPYKYGGELLDLRLPEQSHLFYANDRNGMASVSMVKSAEAAKTLRKLADSGVVDWSHCASYRAPS